MGLIRDGECIPLAELLRRMDPNATESSIGDTEWAIMQFMKPDEETPNGQK